MLSKRLFAIAAFVPSGCIAADIGTDHADLPVYLVKNQVCPRVIAVENKRGPWLRAREAIANLGLQNYIELRLGNGLQVLAPGEAQVLVFGGMGASTIQKALVAAPEVWRSANRLILQPQTEWADLRRWLASCGWRLVGEELVYEGGRFYTVMALGAGISPAYSHVEWDLGPLLLERRHPLLIYLVEKKIAKLERIKHNLATSGQSSLQARRQQIEEELAQLEEIKQCLQAARKL